jgi:hypothetical protein
MYSIHAIKAAKTWRDVTRCPSVNTHTPRAHSGGLSMHWSLTALHFAMRHGRGRLHSHTAVQLRPVRCCCCCCCCCIICRDEACGSRVSLMLCKTCSPCVSIVANLTYDWSILHGTLTSPYTTIIMISPASNSWLKSHAIRQSYIYNPLSAIQQDACINNQKYLLYDCFSWTNLGKNF